MWEPEKGHFLRGAHSLSSYARTNKFVHATRPPIEPTFVSWWLLPPFTHKYLKVVKTVSYEYDLPELIEKLHLYYFIFDFVVFKPICVHLCESVAEWLLRK